MAGAGGIGTRDSRESERDDEQGEEGANTGHVNLRYRGVVSTQQDITSSERKRPFFRAFLRHRRAILRLL